MKKVGVIPPILLYMLVSLSMFTQTCTSPALPTIANSLNVSGGLVQFSSTLYFFGFALGILTLGRISDIYGRKVVVIGGMVIYMLGNFFMYMCDNIESFLVLRFLVAYGGSVSSSMAHAMNRDSYKGWELSHMYANITLLVACMSAIGSMTGGFIMELCGCWRYIFLFLSTLSCLLLIVYIKFLPETNPYIGVASDHKFFNVAKTTARDKKFIGCGIIIGLYHGICFGFFIQAPFIFIDRLKMDPFDYGKLFCILSIVGILGGVLTKYLVKRFVDKITIRIIGFCFSITGCILLIIASCVLNNIDDLSYNIILIFGAITVHLLGHPMILSTTMSVALVDYNKVNGAAGSIFGSLYYSVSACVSGIIALLHSNKINNYSLLFAVLLSLCLIIFYYTNKMEINNKYYNNADR